MANENNNINDAVNKFKNTLQDLKKKKMYDTAVEKYEKEREDRKRNPLKDKKQGS